MPGGTPVVQTPTRGGAPTTKVRASPAPHNMQPSPLPSRPSSMMEPPADWDAAIALRHSSPLEVLTREGTYVGSGKWVRVNATLVNTSLRIDNLGAPMKGQRSSHYSKEMTITAGTSVVKSPQPGRPFCLSLADFNAASGKKRVLDCLNQGSANKWYDLLRKVATTDLDTLLEPLREAREKERDATELERALASRPCKVDTALLALRRGRLHVDYVAKDATDRGVTALLAAARAARADVVQNLLDLGAAPDGPPGDESDYSAVGETPLLGAVRADALAATQALLDAGASPTQADDSRETPLLVAARNGYADVTAALLHALADKAAAITDEKYRAKLLGHVDEEWGLDPATPLVAGAIAGHAAVVTALLLGSAAQTSSGRTIRVKADVNRNVNGRTALHHAALRGRAAVITPLAEAGADVDGVDHDGHSALHLATTEGRIATVAALLQNDAQAATGGDRMPSTRSLRLRANKGGDEEEEDDDDDLASVASGDEAEQNAHKKKKKKKSVTMMTTGGGDLRSERGSRRSYELIAATTELRAALGARDFDAAHAAELANQVRAVLRDSHVDVTDDERPDHDSMLRNFPADLCALAPAPRQTALLRCCHAGDGRGVELWLTLGADANHADHGTDRWTPLMACAYRGDAQLAKLLLATQRVEVDHRDATGATALYHTACAAARARSVPATAASARDVAALLLKHGADPVLRDASGAKSPLSIASADARDAHLVDLMLSTKAELADGASNHHARGSSSSSSSSFLSASAAAASSGGALAAAPTNKGAGRSSTAVVDVDAPHGSYRSTALMLAAALPEASAVLRTLLGAHELAADAALKRPKSRKRRHDACASLPKLDARGRSALFYAAEADRAENVELILSFGRRMSTAFAAESMLDVDAVDADHHTALQVATAARAKGAVGALLRFGASAQASTNDRGLLDDHHKAGRKGKTNKSVDKAATSTPSARGHHRYSDDDDDDEDDRASRMKKRPLSLAIEVGDFMIANTLGRFRSAILSGDDAATLRYVDRGNYEVDEPAGVSEGAPTALVVACRLGHARAALRLLEAGADVNRTDANGEAPLLAAARSGSLTDAALLPSEGGPTLLAATTLAELLLDRGADVNAADDDLHESVLLVVASSAFFAGGARRRGACASLLLARGADPLHADARGYTPLLVASGAWPPFDGEEEAGEYAQLQQREREPRDATVVLEALVHHHKTHPFDLDRLHCLEGGSSLTALGAAALAGRALAVRTLLAAGANPTAPADGNDSAALTLAASCGHARVVRVIEHECDRCDHSAALAAAALAGHAAAVVALLRAGASAASAASVVVVRGAGDDDTTTTDGAQRRKTTPKKAAPPQRVYATDADDVDDDNADPDDDMSSNNNPPSKGEEEDPLRRTMPYDGDERSVADRRLAVATQLDAMRLSIRAADYGRAAHLALRSNFELESGDGAEALIAAARDGDAAGVEELIAAAPAIAATLAPRALEAAAAFRRLEAAVALLRQMERAKVAGTSVGECPTKPESLAALLALAVDLGHEDLARLALAAGADAALPSDGHVAGGVELSALARAACAPPPRGPAMLRTLLQVDDDHDHDHDDPQRPPEEKDAAAAKMRVKQALKTLKRANQHRLAPLHAAAAADRVESLATLLGVEKRAAAGSKAGGFAFVSDASRHTPLHVAAATRAYDACAVLVALHAQHDDLRKKLLGSRDLAGVAALHLAASADDGAITALLLAAGANAEAADSAGRRAADGTVLPSMGRAAARRLAVMRRAIQDGDFDAALRLVARGSFGIGTGSSRGQTVLTRAAFCGRADVVLAALEHGAAQPALSRKPSEISPSPSLRADILLAQAAGANHNNALTPNSRPASTQSTASSAAGHLHHTPGSSLHHGAASSLLASTSSTPTTTARSSAAGTLTTAVRPAAAAGGLAPAGKSTAANHPPSSSLASSKSANRLPAATKTNASATAANTNNNNNNNNSNNSSSINNNNNNNNSMDTSSVQGSSSSNHGDNHPSTPRRMSRDGGMEEILAALHAAAKARQPASAEALLRARNDVVPYPGDAAELVRVAVARRRHALTELLLVRTAEPLAACDTVGREDAMQLADVSFEAEVDRPDAKTTPFVLAVQSGDLEAVRIFLDQRVAVFDVDSRSDLGETALMVALSHGHVSVAHALLAAGADPTARDNFGRSALERACFDDASEKAELCLVRDVTDAIDAGLKMPAQRELDRALLLAVAQRHARAVAALCRTGANALAKVSDAKSRSSVETALLRACAAPDLETLRALIHTVPVALDTPHGTTRATALHVCAVSGDADALTLLLDAKADATFVDANLRSALWHAAARGHAAAVDVLAKRVPREALNAADAHGATALHAAARVGARGAIAALLNAGADATAMDKAQRTPRRVARQSGHSDAAKQLDAMSAAIDDGDFAECIRLARNGNWPLDYHAGDDLEDDDFK